MRNIAKINQNNHLNTQKRSKFLRFLSEICKTSEQFRGMEQLGNSLKTTPSIQVSSSRLRRYKNKFLLESPSRIPRNKTLINLVFQQIRADRTKFWRKKSSNDLNVAVMGYSKRCLGEDMGNESNFNEFGRNKGVRTLEISQSSTTCFKFWNFAKFFPK